MKNKLAANTLTSLLYQLTAIVCGFIVPHLIITNYGSELNGLVNSISQFLSFIAFLEFGVGAVIQSVLYEPLALHNNEKISAIMVSGRRFYNKIGFVLLIYVSALIIVYPLAVNNSYDWLYTSTLILAISITFFAQYYSGITDQLLLAADQKVYIQNIVQIITLIINTVVSILLIMHGVGIHIVELTRSFIYVLRPVFFRWYVRKNYQIDKKYKYGKEAIEQKWNGVAQHVSAVILTGTDTIVLTLFSNLKYVSIYSVYYMVISGLSSLFRSVNSGFRAFIGNLWAKQEIEKLNHIFGVMEWFIHTSVVFVFGCTLVLLVPFVRVYTNGIHDVEYAQTLFSIIITLAYMMNMLSIPYQAMIFAAGHYRQTQRQFVFTAAINILLSILMVYQYGLIGVAVGTLVAMFYQFLWMTRYVSKNINCWPIRNVIRQVIYDIIMLIVQVILCSTIQLTSETYAAWVFMAVKVGLINLFVLGIFNILFCREKIRDFIRYMRER